MQLDDKRLWRKALACAHPDAGGDEEAFKFLSNMRDFVHDEYPKLIEHIQAQEEEIARLRAEIAKRQVPATAYTVMGGAATGNVVFTVRSG